ncbi:hypothetical protein CP532_5978 [Ophiocordyceps camponoti-leonardi (nom. inval.)]|nr:hypothetical protein CP532_5978 [Ophiocordyceps camponoti-leonardi (nom. inval.)]
MGRSCCGSPRQLDDTGKIRNGCNQDPSTSISGQQKAAEAPCPDTCCGDEPTDPDCCRGKPSPCCDDSCIERLALRECDAGCAVKESSSIDVLTLAATPCQPEEKKRSPCDSHRQYARERYGTTLEALGCICRALLALGQESCCRTSSLKGKSGVKPTSASAESCCASGRAERPSSFESKARTRKMAACTRSLNSAPDVCAGQSCCQSVKAVSVDNVDIEEPPKATETTNPPLTIADPENQTAGVEHVVLCMSGMTCTGCETKLNRTLAIVTGVKGLKTSLVLSRAEFDVDLHLTTVEDVMKHLERTTEFECERITSSGSSIDVVVPGDDTSAFIARDWPEGVTDMTLVKGNVVRVSFDPTVVGARDLATNTLGQGLELAPLQGDQSLEAGNKHVRHVGLMTILSSILTIPVLIMAWAPLPPREIVYASASLALATIVQVVVAGPFYPKALKALVYSRVIEMDLLIVLSTTAAFVFSVVSFGYLVAERPLSTGLFFEASTLLVSLIMVGRYVAALARQKAVESISFKSLQNQTALLVDGSEEREIDARLLQYGDYLKVLPDTRIPTDGTVVTGTSEVDESMLTGESRPVDKRAKSNVIAGTINGSGVMVVRLNRLPGDNTITTIAAMVDEAKLSKSNLQRLADRVASMFVPVVVALTVVTFAVWLVVGVKVQGKTGSEASVKAITCAMAVLIVSCPCAIGLAVPMVVVIASGVAAEKGIIFKSAEAIELAYRASHVVFDKTGTLTQGKLSVICENWLVDEHTWRPFLLGMVSNSRHPVSEAIAKYLQGRGVTAVSIPDVISLPGCGLEAEINGHMLRAGNSRWAKVTYHALVQSTLVQGHTVFCLSVDDKLAAVFGLEDPLRDEAAEAVASLQLRGITLHLVSGDDDQAVLGAATRLGIPHDKTRSRSSPGDKQAYVQGLVQDGIVVFCGDGTNDAVALAQASVGVHMNHGSDVAQCAADVVLVRPDPARILSMMDLSRRAVRRIVFNFAWSFVYNTLAVLLASGALVRFRVAPQYAGLGELVSVLPVVAAAVLLRWQGVLVWFSDGNF